jgi:hypothetical protein
MTQSTNAKSDLLDPIAFASILEELKSKLKRDKSP